MATWKITREKPVFNEDGTRKYEPRKSDGRNEPVSKWLDFGIFVGTHAQVDAHIEVLQAMGGSFGATLTKGDPKSADPN